MNRLDFLKATSPEEFAMRSRLAEGAKSGNEDGLPWWQAATGRLLKAAPEGEGKAGPYDFTISTPTVDRYADIVDPGGIDNTNFRKNAVVLWGHSDLALPIGRSLEEKLVGSATEGRYDASMEFDLDNDPDGLASAIKGKVDKKHISATSIRFLPHSYELIYEEVELENGGKEERGTGGFHFKETELLEWSIVAVPANPDTVKLAYGVLNKGYAESDLDEKILKAVHELVPDIAEFRKELGELRGLIGEIEAGKATIGAKVRAAMEAERAIDILRDLSTSLTKE
jgi:hypothetical protein